MVRIPLAIDHLQLFIELSAQLHFPDYLGFNWNSLYDLFCDFSWIKQKRLL